MKRFVLLTCAALLSSSVFAQKELVELWETKGLPTPESVLYAPNNDLLYVSLIDGDAMTKDGKGGVAILNRDGTIKDAEWFTGMDAPKGLAIYGELLYVADVTSVWAIDMITGNLVSQIEVPGAVMLNDVTIDDNGVVYFSDTRTGTIYRMQNDKPEVFLENAPAVNGLKMVGNSLYALVGPELWKIEANKKHTVVAKGFELGGDGLEPVGAGDFLVTCWGGLIYYVKADGSYEQLLDVQGKMNTADLGFHAPSNTVYISTFLNNSVKAFTLK